ncbi:MAG: hypothetical protein AAGL10_01055 [Pseudomonadota bacterium]
MFRTETTLVVGAGANREIEMPDGPELLNRITASFDFDRLGSEVQSRDLVNLAEIFEATAPRCNASTEDLMNAGRKIRAAASITTSIESIMEQLSDDPLVTIAGKIGIVYHTLHAEAKSTLAREPRVKGEMPLRGTENWLFKLGQMIVTGAPRREAENCFYKLSIIAFTYDRAIEHYLRGLPRWLSGWISMRLVHWSICMSGLFIRSARQANCLGSRMTNQLPIGDRLNPMIMQN